jgi:outer membrane protein assembly factor BamD (BamD/ComL family)
MSYRIKVPAKTLQVDEAHFLSGLEHTLIRLQEYRRPLLVGLGVFLLAVGVVGGVFWMDRQASQKAAELEHEATRLFMNRQAGDPKKADELLKQAISQYRQIIDQYPRTPTAPLALFHLGNALVQSNDLPGAIEAYQRFILLYGSQPSLAGLAQQRLAYAYLLKGDRDQAVKAFTSILDSPGTLNKDQALFELARLEESQSRPEGAMAHYQELMKSYPNSPYASEATIRTRILDPKKTSESSPAVPSPAPSGSAVPQKNSQLTPPVPAAKKP